MLRFVWTFHWHAEVVGLFLGELGQLHADAFEVQAGVLFVRLSGHAINIDFIWVAVGLEVYSVAIEP